MSRSLLARGLLLTLALSSLAAPAALAEDPGTTTETSSTTTTTATTSTITTEAAPDPWAETPQTRSLLARALDRRAVARRWRALMRRPMPHVYASSVDFQSLLATRRWLLQAWRRKAYWARWRGHRPPHLRAWLCIHRYEGNWQDPNAPYYGGLQMDLAFQRRYALELVRRKGTANHWTRFEQMWVAERAHRAGRGFYAWPTTARYCGLI
jgi:hypothetical protein